MAAAVVVTVVTGADYVVRAVRLRRSAALAGPSAGHRRLCDARRRGTPAAARSLEWPRRSSSVLVARGQTLAVAESLTGGLVAAALTAMPGASAAFRGGVVAYATDLKAALLGVPADLLDRHGPCTRGGRGHGRGRPAGGWAPPSGRRPPAWPARSRPRPAGRHGIYRGQRGRRTTGRPLLALAGDRQQIRRGHGRSRCSNCYRRMREDNI